MQVAVLGEWTRIQGFALAGARMLAAEDADAVRSAWRSLDLDIAIVIVTPQAAAALGRDRPTGSRARGHEPLLVVMPA